MAVTTDAPTSVKPASKGSLFVIFLTVFIDLLGFGMVLPLLPIYAVQFTTDESGLLIGLLMASFSAMQFFFAPVWGRLSDRVGRRPILMLGLAGSVTCYTLFGFATIWRNLVLLFVARIGAGIAGATIPTAQAYIADCTTLNTRAKGMALIGAAFGLGFTFGPLFGYLAVPTGRGDPGPGPGFAAAALSAVALLLAYFKLPESLNRGSQPAVERRMIDLAGLRAALATPSVGPLLVTLFVCIFAFANFESTLSMLIKGDRIDSGFRFDFQQVCLTYAYIGLVLTLAQGVIVRRLSTRLPEALMAVTGGIAEIIGFGLLVAATQGQSPALLLTSLAIVTTGFAFMMPSINSLISRRSDPAKQGGILGIAQSISSLARILGPMFGIPLLAHGATLPYLVAAVLMGLGLLLVIVAARGGTDYGTTAAVGGQE